MRPIIDMRFGSHLYGTSTPASDLDLKAVHLPAARDIVLLRVPGVVSTNTKSDPRQKNTAEDVDTESFALHKFLKLASEGQTVAVDMMFAPDWSWIGAPDPLWLKILDNRHRLLTRQSASFVGYCRTQANKYGIRGSRVAAARAGLALMKSYVDNGVGTHKLGTFAAEVAALSAEQEHMAVINIPSQAGTEVLHWEVCNRKMPYTASIKSAHDILQRIVDEYGHRALAAEKNQGVDWKALSHAVRIARQAIELLTTAEVTFPRPEAEHLLAIKTGQLEYAVVAEEIDALLIEVEQAAGMSSLPESPDHAWIENLVANTYATVVMEWKA